MLFKKQKEEKTSCVKMWRSVAAAASTTTKSDSKDTTCDIVSSSLSDLRCSTLTGTQNKDSLDDSFRRADLKPRSSAIRFDPKETRLRKEGFFGPDSAEAEMRKELLKAKSRHQSANDAKVVSNDEGYDGSETGGENQQQAALRRRKPVSWTSHTGPNQNQQRLSLPQIPDNFYRPMVASRLYKVIVIGEIHTGKSALIRRYIHNFYSQNYCATIGVDFRLKLIHYNDDLEIRLQLWDIAGQERFSSMTRAYYKGTMGAIVVFDYSNAKTYQAAVDRWKRDLDDKCSLPGNRSVPAILVANKSDLKRDKNLPDDVEISREVQERGFVPKWYKTSAKTGENVEEAMALIIKYIMTLDTWSEGEGAASDLEESGGDLDPTLMLSPLARTTSRHPLSSRGAAKVRTCYC